MGLGKKSFCDSLLCSVWSLTWLVKAYPVAWEPSLQTVYSDSLLGHMLAEALSAVVPAMYHVWVLGLKSFRDAQVNWHWSESHVFLFTDKWRGENEKKKKQVWFAHHCIFGLISFIKERVFTLFLHWIWMRKCPDHRVLWFFFTDVSASHEAPRSRTRKIQRREGSKRHKLMAQICFGGL